MPRLKLEMLVPAERAGEVSKAIAVLAAAPFTEDDKTVLEYDVGTPFIPGAVVRYYL